MKMSAQASLALASMAVLLSGCRPYGCDTDECVRQAPFARAKHCYAAYEAAVHVLRDPRTRTQIDAREGLMESQAAHHLNAALTSGRELGLDRTRIYGELERERMAYLGPFITRATTPAQYAALVDTVNNCETAEDL
ncbi:hypothetical protein OMW55_12115 [Sphingomonas sp. BN140010]|uniref:Lipoprotein n=1 Tax=Sphingomonas arvum TaxID=2992113 RepID=A0ABT3JHK5_9SPHN|nr:hypothetical protein [Sphingomonas sp. BN140010]MCW3798552.1 hypothetical protein [Sphingomonas sp. BN140010]